MKELYAALIKAQAEFPVIPKDKQAYNYKYADLATVISAVGAPLAKHGLCISQTMYRDGGELYLRTTLFHTSGESLVSEGWKITSLKPQEQGSLITYGRRYMLNAILGISPDDDDDGASANNAEVKKSNQPILNSAMISEKQVDLLRRVASESGYKNPGHILKEEFGIVGTTNITRDQFQPILERFQRPAGDFDKFDERAPVQLS